MNSVTRVADGHGRVEPRLDPLSDRKRDAKGILDVVLSMGGLACGRKASANVDFFASFAAVFSDDNGSALFLEAFGVASSSPSTA